MFICGDIVNRQNSQNICDKELKEIIKKSDYAICNFEAPIEDYGVKIKKSGIHLHQKKDTIKILKNTGFKLLCLSNNHIMDYGKEALYATINEIQRNNLEQIGAGLDFLSAYRPLIKQFGDTKIGIINCCEAQFGVLDNKSKTDDAGYAWINHRIVYKTVLELKKQCDIVILLPHAGLEDVSIPLIEWREKYKLFCNLGVDLIVGSHPHVPQGYEKYKNSYIFYSLGNFYFDDNKPFFGKRDSSYSLSIIIADRKIKSVNFIFHYTKNNEVCLATKDEVDIERLNNLLGEDYKQVHKEICKETYKSIFGRTTLFSLNALPFKGYFIYSIKRIIKNNNIIRRIFNKDDIDKTLTAMHFLRNESYYYVIKNALLDRVYEKS